MKAWTLAGVLVFCLFAPHRAVAAADDAPLFRVFLTDGSTLVSYGEFARVGDRVVFSMALGAGASASLHVVNIPASRVDWARTNRYADSARAIRYISTQAQTDYMVLSNDVARTLNEVANAQDAPTRLALVESARRMLADWPQSHFNYRSAEVRQMLGALDDAIADLRASTGDGRFNLSLTATVGDPPILEPMLPPPTPKDAIEQALLAARLSESSADRESLMSAALAEIDRSAAVLPSAWLAATRDATTAALQEEVRVDGEYQTLSARMMAVAAERTARADVRGVERVLTAVRRSDAQLGAKRPDAFAALLTAVEAKLDLARQLRLARDRWALRLPDLQKYRTAIAEPIDLFALFRRVQPSLEDIKLLAGSSPWALAATERTVSEILKRASLIDPPDELRDAHALLVSAAQMAQNAAMIRREATVSGSMPRAWDASSAAAGALMLAARARSGIDASLRPPDLSAIQPRF